MKQILLLNTGLAFGLLLVAPLTATAGYYYESTTTIQTQGQRGTEEIKVKGWIEGDKSRIDFLTDQKGTPIAEGNYLISTNGGENVHLVDPKEKTYGKFSLKDLMAGLGQAMEAMKKMGGMMKMEFTDLSTEKLLEEPGEEILGYPTTHYRYKSNYTMNMSIMGMKQASKTEMVQEIWSTDAVEAEGFGMWLSPGRAVNTGNEEFDKVISQQMGQVQGFPLKMVNESTVTATRGRAQSSRQTTEVTVLREEAVDDEVFEWPSDYTEIEIIPEMPDMPDMQGIPGLSR